MHDNDIQGVGAGAFSIAAGVFLRAVALAAKAVVAKPVMPALENLRFDIHDGYLTLSGSDTETTVSVRRELITCGYNGSFLVLPAMVRDPLKGLSASRLDFRVEGWSLTISWPGGEVSMPVMSSDEWPAEDSVQGESFSARTISGDLLSAMSLTDYACAKDETRPQICGMDFEFQGDGLVLVATDAHVLAATTLPQAAAPRAFSFILPRRTASVLKSLLGGSLDVDVRCDDRFVSFSIADAGILVRGRLVEGAFPNWRSIVPHDPPVTARTARGAVLEACTRMGACSGTGRLVVLSFRASTMEVSAADLGMQLSGHETVPVRMEGGDGIEIGFRAEGLMSVLDNMPGITLRIGMTDAGKAAVMRDDDEDRKRMHTLAVIMPVMIDKE